jgi:hypothetical protein
LIVNKDPRTSETEIQQARPWFLIILLYRLPINYKTYRTVPENTLP